MGAQSNQDTQQALSQPGSLETAKRTSNILTESYTVSFRDFRSEWPLLRSGIALQALLRSRKTTRPKRSSI